MSASAANTVTYLAVVLGGLTALMVIVRSLQHRARIGAETARKIVHVGMGLICLPLPWWFTTLAPVLILAGATSIALLVVRYVPAVSRQFGSVLGATGRASFGEFYYPVGILTALTICGRERDAYCGAVGVLTFGDMAGAIIGQKYGRLRYTIGGNRKSIEGSLAVLLISFIWIAFSVGLTSSGRGPQLILASLSTAAIAAMLEAISRRGFDNLLLPSGTAIVLLGWKQSTLVPSEAVRMGTIIGSAVALSFCFVSAVAIIRTRVQGRASTIE